MAMNEQALGWIVAGVERGTGFISAAGTRENAPVHGVFRGWFQTISSACPRAIRRGVGGRRAGRPASRKLVGHFPWQFLRRWWRAGLVHRRRNLRVRIAR